MSTVYISLTTSEGWQSEMALLVFVLNKTCKVFSCTVANISFFISFNFSVHGNGMGEFSSREGGEHR